MTSSRRAPFTWFNYAFGRVTHRYLRAVRFIKDSGLRAMILFGVMVVAIVWLLKVVPGGPGANSEDQGYILGIAASWPTARPSTGPRRSPTP